MPEEEINMEEEKKKAEIEIQTLKGSLEANWRDVENKESEIDEMTFSVASLKAEVDNLKAEQELFPKISEVMLGSYRKIKPEHAWEEKPEYWDLLKQQQAINNKRAENEYVGKLRQAEKRIKLTTDQIQSLKTNLVILRESTIPEIMYKLEELGISQIEE